MCKLRYNCPFRDVTQPCDTKTGELASTLAGINTGDVIDRNFTTTPTLVKVAIYEDNDSLRQALSVLIGGTPEYELTGAYEHCRNLETDLAANRPDVVLMDIDLPGRSGIEGVALMRKNFPGTEALMLTVFDDDDRVFQAVCAGASGYLLKKTPPAKILEAIREVCEGGAPMTPVIARKVLQLFPGKPAATPEPNRLSAREQEVLNLLAKGYPYKAIGPELGISLDTTRTHIRRIYEKLQVHSVAEAIVKGFLK